MTKTILITGATSGFGRAAAGKFAAGGWRVIGTGRRAERLRELQDELGEAFLPLEVDMRDKDAVAGLAKLSAPWGDIDLLLNNAGLAPPTTPLPDTDWDRIEEVIDTNVNGLVALTRVLLPKLVEGRARFPILICGVVWGVWHMVFVLLMYEHHRVANALLYGLLCLAGGVFICWLRLASGSVFVAAVAHSAYNSFFQNFYDHSFTGPTKWLWAGDVGLLCSLSSGIVAWWLSRTGRLARPGITGACSFPTRTP